jgi:hypothetical protein
MSQASHILSVPKSIEARSTTGNLPDNSRNRFRLRQVRKELKKTDKIQYLPLSQAPALVISFQ